VGNAESRVETAPIRAAEARRLRSDVFVTFGSKVLIGAAAFAASVATARELGPPGRGLLAVALTLNATLIQVGHLGLVSANPYFAARNPRVIPQMVCNSLAWAAVAGSTIASVVVFLKIAWPELVPGIGWPPLLTALLTVPAAIAAILLQGILLGEGRMIAYNLPQAILSVLTVVIIVVAALVADLTVTIAVGLLLAQWIVAVPVYLLLTGRKPFKSRPDLMLARRMFKYAVRIYAATVLSFLLIRFDLFLVNAYLGAEQAGLYSAATILSEAMFLLPIAIGMNIFFRISRGDSGEITARVFRMMLVLYGAFCLASAVLAYPVFMILFGDAFSESITLFQWLLPGIFSLGMLTLLSYHFAGRGYPREAILHWIAALGLNLLLNIALLRELGTYFAALASSIAYTLVFVLHVRLYAQEVGWTALRPRLAEFSRV
jgi:O-antigen/teichoic acid export membrane protein